MPNDKNEIAVSRMAKVPKSSSTIRLNLADLDQLIVKNPIHPGAGINAEAAEYIYNEADDAPLDEPLSLKILLPGREANAEQQSQIAEALQTYATYQSTLAKRELRRTYQRGWRSTMKAALVILCLVAIGYFVDFLELSTGLNELAIGILTVIGWISCWTPVETFLYRWWEPARKAKVYENIASAEVEVIAEEKP